MLGNDDDSMDAFVSFDNVCFMAMEYIYIILVMWKESKRRVMIREAESAVFTGIFS
jgi:hypothetical protein